MEKSLEDMARARKIARKLKNEKRPWFSKQYLGRNLLQWGNLYLALIIIIMTLHRGPTWTPYDLILMVIAGINISIWIWGGFTNIQGEFIEELIEMNHKTIKLANRAMEDKIGFTRGDDEYYEIRDRF